MKNLRLYWFDVRERERQLQITRGDGTRSTGRHALQADYSQRDVVTATTITGRMMYPAERDRFAWLR